MKPPFQLRNELFQFHEPCGPADCHLPGHPLVPLSDVRGLQDFLAREFVSPVLEQIAPRLWWMSKQNSGNISPLHRQIVKRRSAVVTEDPKLHLVWIRDRIFIKPIFIKPLPAYIISHRFWTDHLPGASEGAIDAGDAKLSTDPGAMPPNVRRAALGYLRTYTHLIRHESDFRIAMDPRLQLLPKGTTWPAFCRFAADVRESVSDEDVSERHRYGEIRLTRLNFYVRFLVGFHARYQSVETQYSECFARIYGPVLFCIGILSLLLSSLQVIVAAAEADAAGIVEDVRQKVLLLALWFSVAVFLMFCTVGIGIAFVFVYKVAREWKYALTDRKKRLQRKGSGLNV